MNNTRLALLSAVVLMGGGIAVYVVWKRPVPPTHHSSLPSPEPSSTSTDISVRNISIQEITTTTKTGWELTAQTLDIDPHTKNMSGDHATCIIMSHNALFGSITSPHVDITTKTKNVVLAAPVLGTFEHDITVETGKLTYHHASHTLSSPHNITCSHPHGRHTAHALHVDVRKKVLTLSGGVTSVLYASPTNHRRQNHARTKR